MTDRDKVKRIREILSRADRALSYVDSLCNSRNPGASRNACNDALGDLAAAKSALEDMRDVYRSRAARAEAKVKA